VLPATAVPALFPGANASRVCWTACCTSGVDNAATGKLHASASKSQHNNKSSANPRFMKPSKTSPLEKNIKNILIVLAGIVPFRIAAISIECPTVLQRAGGYL
jgi:hypothetical protein